MVRADGHSHAPAPESIDNVVDAYWKHGLMLVIDPQHTAIPEVGTTFFPGGANGQADSVDFSELKAAYFHPRDHRAWHYMIFANEVSYDGFLAGGAAELPGYDFVVSGAQVDAIAGIPDVRPLVEGGLFMHELGHNLDLHHGGDTDAPYKPNYMSVMGYLYISGIATSPVPGTLTRPFSHRLDYSDRVLPPLDESALNEYAGVGTGDGDIVRWMAQSRATGFFYGNLRAPGIGPIDWDLSGSLDSSEEWDIDFDFISGPDNTPPYVEWKPWILTGFDDWSHIKEFVNAPEYRLGEVRRGLPRHPCPDPLRYSIPDM